MHIRMLGPLEIGNGDASVPLGPPKQRTVAALLLVRANLAVPVEEIVDELWPERPPRSALANVRLYASRLAQLFAAECRTSVLVRRGAGYVLTSDVADQDVSDFRLRADRGRDLLARGEPSAAVAELDGGLELWRGPAVADVTVGPVLSGWRVALAQERLRAIEDHAEALSAVGEYGRVVTQVRDLLAVEPLRERAHELLIRAYYASGDVAGALAAFDDVRRQMLDELGVEPGEPLEALQWAIRSRDPALSGPNSATPICTARAIAAVPGQLPADMRAFTGRQEALRRLDTVVGRAGGESGSATIAVVSGTGGVGKTALTVHWAHRVAGRFPDGQLYVNLRGFGPAGRVMTPAEAVRGFLDALGVLDARVPAGLDAQVGLYRRLVAGRRVLILLDNARDVDQVRPLLPTTATAVVVVTSRHQLTGLVAADGAEPLTLGVLSEVEARGLLARRLGAARVGAEPQAVGDIIAACAGLPLALVIAAARAQQTRFPLTALAAELARAGERLDALDTGDPTGQIRAVFSWSYAALSRPARRLFRLLGLHPGPDLSAAAAAGLAGHPVAGARRLLGELVRESLVIEHRPGRYVLHDLLRAYAAELVDTDESDAARRAATARLLDHYLHTADVADHLLNPIRDAIDIPLSPAVADARPQHLPDAEAATGWLDAEHAVLLAIVRHAAAGGYDLHAWQLVSSLRSYLFRKGSWGDRVTAGRWALEAALRLGNLAAQAASLHEIAHAHLQAGRHADSRTHLRRALRLYLRIGHQLGQANVHRSSAGLRGRQGRYDLMLHHARRALALYEELGHRRRAAALGDVGLALALLGDGAQALGYCRQALALQEQLGDRSAQASSLYGLAYAHRQLGNYAEAVGCYERALAILRTIGDRYNQAEILTSIGDTHHATGRRAAAREAWVDALRVLTDLGHDDARKVRAKLDAGDGDATDPEQDGGAQASGRDVDGGAGMTIQCAEAMR